METVNPYTKTLIHKYTPTTPLEVEAKLSLAHRAFATARRLTTNERAKLLIAAADLVNNRQTELAQLAVTEMGKTLSAARAEVLKCEATTRYFADHIEELIAPQKIADSKATKFVKPLPIGCILAVMPWNFPYWQAFRAALAALSTGNTMVLKHASNVSGCALAIEKIFADSGWPKGAFQTLLISSDKVASIIEDRRIAAVTLTGSEAAGRSVAEIAGRNLKKSVLELGGSDPFIVTAQADVKAAAKAGAKARTINNGQSCIAAKRFIVESSVYKTFVSEFTETVKQMKLGDPMNEVTEIGPLVNEKAFRDLKSQYDRAINDGAKILLEPKLIEEKNLFGPAILEVPKDKINQGVFAEEFFGPVALFYEVKNLDEAIEVANASSFGLGSSIWTSSQQEIERAVNEIEAGMTFVNSIVASEAALPFGGVKNSGYGRELGILGPHEFVNMKSVSISNPDTTKKTGD